MLEKLLVLINTLTLSSNLGSTEDSDFQGGNTVVSQGTKNFTELDAYMTSNCFELLTVEQQAKTGPCVLPEVMNKNYHEASGLTLHHGSKQCLEPRVFTRVALSASVELCIVLIVSGQHMDS